MKNIWIGIDTGGTFTDVCLIRSGESAQKALREVGGLPVRTHTIDIHTIGAGGGLSGAPGAFVVNPGLPDERTLPSAAADVPLPPGSVLSIRTPGGGGFGTVEHRDPQQIERDVRGERISIEQAKGVYRWHTPA